MHIVVPEAEAILDKAFPVLNHGFVRLVDYLGGDARIVQAARVSYGPGTKTVREDRGLIHYLMRNRHTSPFEMVRLLFHVKLPIFVARQWIRHRTACLTGDTMVTLAEETGKGAPFQKRSLSTLWQMWYTEWEKELPRNRENVLPLSFPYPIRVLNEKTGEFTIGQIQDIIFTGMQPVYRCLLQHDKCIALTANHRIYTTQGWRRMGEAIGLEHSENDEVVMTRPCSIWGIVDSSNSPLLRKGGKNQRRVEPIAVMDIEYIGEQPTYDICVQGPWHNFVANDLVVHNSVNEISGRYSVMSDEFYVPPPEDIRFQSKRNKQGRAEEEMVPPELQAKVLEILVRDQKTVYTSYEEMLQDNIARELARVNLPLSLYTQWYWQIDLHNLLHFLRLRLDTHAQKEIRAYAEVIAHITKTVAPLTYEAFEEHILYGTTFSRTEMEALRKVVQGEPNPLTGRAKEEFEAKLGMTLPD